MTNNTIKQQYGTERPRMTSTGHAQELMVPARTAPALHNELNGLLWIQALGHTKASNGPRTKSTSPVLPVTGPARD